METRAPERNRDSRTPSFRILESALELLDEAETEIQGVPRAMSRWVRSKKTPPTQRETGNNNMLYPNLFGQSEIGIPDP